MGNSASRFVWYELATSDIEGQGILYQRHGLGHNGCLDAGFELYPIYSRRHPRRWAAETAGGIIRRPSGRQIFQTESQVSTLLRRMLSSATNARRKLFN